MKRILVVIAHPDDEVLGMGGTIAKYTANGDEVAVLIVTDGSTTQYKDDPKTNDIIEAKRRETQLATKVLGVNNLYYGNLPDMCLDITAHTKVNQVIEKVINEYDPDVVYTHYYGDVNRDHQCVFQSVLVACRPVPGQKVRELYSFSIPSSTEWSPQTSQYIFTPNMYVDISGDFAEKKYEAMNAYQTELRVYPHPRSIEALKIFDKATGLNVGLECAESFVIHRVIR